MSTVTVHRTQPNQGMPSALLDPKSTKLCGASVIVWLLVPSVTRPVMSVPVPRVMMNELVPRKYATMYPLIAPTAPPAKTLIIIDSGTGS